MNTDGFALADTQTATADHGPGLLRYVLMTRLLARCATVEEALSEMASVPLTGGASLVLGDAAGAAAWVELSHSRGDVARGACVAHTSHDIAAPEALPPRTGPVAEARGRGMGLPRPIRAGRGRDALRDGVGPLRGGRGWRETHASA
jgi:hypothetical protein